MFAIFIVTPQTPASRALAALGSMPDAVLPINV